MAGTVMMKKENTDVYASDLRPGQCFVSKKDGLVFIISVRKELHTGHHFIGYARIMRGEQALTVKDYAFSGRFLYNSDGAWREL
jgi:hypothetical protein